MDLVPFLCRSKSIRRGPGPSRPEAWRSNWHLVAEPLRMARDAVCDRRARFDSGKHHPGISLARARIRAECIRLPGTRDGRAVEDVKLSGNAAGPSAGAVQLHARRPQGAATAASADADPHGRVGYARNAELLRGDENGSLGAIVRSSGA